MQFVVPKFIEREARVAGPLTFKQLAIFIIAGAICFILYRLLPFVVFFFLSILILFLGFVLAFGEVGGRPVLKIFTSSLTFFLSPKIFIWKKGWKSGLLQKMEIKKGEKKFSPNIIKNSHLEKLKTRIETK
jgi:hypothetical protein